MLFKRCTKCWYNIPMHRKTISTVKLKASLTSHSYFVCVWWAHVSSTLLADFKYIYIYFYISRMKVKKTKQNRKTSVVKKIILTQKISFLGNYLHLDSKAKQKTPHSLGMTMRMRMRMISWVSFSVRCYLRKLCSWPQFSQQPNEAGVTQ